MSKYVDALRDRSARSADLCALGRILDENGEEEYQAVVEAIHGKGPSGSQYPISWLVDVFKDDYGWSEHFFRRHRNGECNSCRNRET